MAAQIRDMLKALLAESSIPVEIECGNFKHTKNASCQLWCIWVEIWRGD